jgi:EXLDI family protein
MPNKTIYVSDDDMPLFERAQELSGDKLSSVIARALRRFVEVEEARGRGLEEITVLVGKPGALRRKRFIGTRLVRVFQDSSKGEVPEAVNIFQGKGTEVVNIYQTAGNRFALHVHTILDWEASWGDPNQAGNPKNWGWVGKLFGKWGYDWESFKESGEHTFDVFETLEELRSHISADLYKAVLYTKDAPPIEDLDI